MGIFGTKDKPSIGKIGKYDTGKTTSVPAMKGGKGGMKGSMKLGKSSGSSKKY